MGRAGSTLIHKHFVHALLIAAVCLVAYSNTYHVPFHFDDNVSIVSNPIVHDFDYIISPSSAKDIPEYGYFIRRYVAYASFALNYRLHGLSVEGYHYFNIILHFLNALLAYYFTVLVLRSPHLSGTSLSRNAGILGLFVGLLFAAHPVQTEAVTYITQRYASLCAFFYLMSAVLYLRARLDQHASGKFNSRAVLFYVLALISAALAMKTKENSLTLPLAIMMIELFFFRGTMKQRAALLVPLFLLLAIFPLSLMQTDMPVGKILFGLEDDSGGYTTRGAFEDDYLYSPVARTEYLTTQFRVIATYLRLLVLPAGQNLDYDYPLFRSLLAPEVLASLTLIAALLAIAAYCLFLSRRKSSEYSLISFGIFWFFLALSVESSILPIPMLIAEYRLYLPSVGIFIAAVAFCSIFIDTIKAKTARTALIAAAVAVVLIFTAAAYSRNSVWQSKASLWKDVTLKSPNKMRGHLNLSKAYMGTGEFAKAAEHARTALTLYPDTWVQIPNEHYAIAQNLLGAAYLRLGQIELAEKHFKESLALWPLNEEAYLNLGAIALAQNKPREAITHSYSALQVNPGAVFAHLNLGDAYLKLDMPEKAAQHYTLFLTGVPGHADAHYRRGLALRKLGLEDEAEKHFRDAEALRAR